MLSSGYGAVARLSKLLVLNIFLTGAALADPVTVLALGDSLTRGYGLPANQGFVPQMQAWLEQAGADITLINAGVSGDTTAGGAARLGWSLTEEVDAVIVALGGNDLLRGTAPEVTRANLDAILSETGARELPVLLVGMRASGNYGPDYKQAFDAIYPALAAAHAVALFPEFLLALTEMEDPALVLRDYMQADGMHPNGAGVALIVARMGPAVLDLIGAVE